MKHPMRFAGESAIVAGYGVLFFSSVFCGEWAAATGDALILTGAVLLLLDLFRE